ncbi:MAG: SAM-dependent DNA methyltransferase [Candidatus Zixiibacteriota bacterium]|nr:MAG: SAM-dependent DNA methyltransferase [candidate division Zixibacteria bacterium]
MMKESKPEKKTKLKEKPTRIPDSRESIWDKAVTEYLQSIKKLNTESARSHRFAMLVHELLQLEPNFIEEYVSGIEKYVKTKNKDRLLRGEMDNLFGNAIIEFEANINKKRREAEEQLRRYVAILWSREKKNLRKPYICIATDGESFITYTPLIADSEAKEIAPEDVVLTILEESDWHRLKPYEIFYWLDRNFLRKEILPPTSESIVKDFGLKSHAFQLTSKSLTEIWNKVKDKGNYAVIYDGWDKYLRIVYGSKVAADDLFVSHTYLASLAKLMAWIRITGTSSLPDDKQILDMLKGELFKSQGIENFIEEDFFSWIAREETNEIGVAAMRWLFSLLQNYNLRELSEDVLKSLYQELVDPATRHNLGEFYTPDWLAHRMVIKMLKDNPEAKVLDPACGSGTFLYFSIRMKREQLGDKVSVLKKILDQVCGMDIHPLATIIAKTNYILALGDLLKKRKSAISIPVYLADTIKLPERWSADPESDYSFNIDSRQVFVPTKMLEDANMYDIAIELSKEYAYQRKSKNISKESFLVYLRAQSFGAQDEATITDAMYEIAKVFKEFIDIGRDTIWAYVIKNIYRPLFLRYRFDVIIGNPPWIAFRFLEPDYQAFLRRQIVDDYKLLIGRAELITQMEIATLFLIRCSDLYSKEGALIGFVLPRSIFSSDQHQRLREHSFRFKEAPDFHLSFKEVWDCEKVDPLFKVPACVIFAEKIKKKRIEKNIPIHSIVGKLNRKNASLNDSEQKLTIEKDKLSLHKIGKRIFWASGVAAKASKPSFYKERFANGATIYPRPFWFVKVKQSPIGVNPDMPLLETADRALEQAKDAYKGLSLSGTIESKFIYATLLSTDLLPFGHLDYRMVILPIMPVEDHYGLTSVKEAEGSGNIGLAKWLERVQKEWETRRGSKAEKMTALEWLNYRRKLVNQNPVTKYRVLYNVSGTYITACVVQNEKIIFSSDSQDISAGGFLADYKTYYCQLSSELEAYYLSSILNAPIINALIKPMQSRGLWGPRDICKKVLDLPIPKYDKNISAHVKLVGLSADCAKKVAEWQKNDGPDKIKSIGKLRAVVRQLLDKELGQIDKLVKDLLK